MCGQRKRGELSPAMLLSMLPMVALPHGLREQVLRLVDDLSPVAGGHRELVARRAEPFDRSGFPKPIASPRRVYGVQALTMAACVAVAAADSAWHRHRSHPGRAAPQGLGDGSAATVGPAAASAGTAVDQLAPGRDALPVEVRAAAAVSSTSA